MSTEEELISRTDLSTLASLRRHISWRKIRQHLHIMETPAESDANAQPMGDATGPKETHHADDTHVEDCTEEAIVRVTSGDNLKSSRLLQLPAELRTSIFEMALFSPLGISLGALAVRGFSKMPSNQDIENSYVFFDPASTQRTRYEDACTKKLVGHRLFDHLPPDPVRDQEAALVQRHQCPWRRI